MFTGMFKAKRQRYNNQLEQYWPVILSTGAAATKNDEK